MKYLSIFFLLFTITAFYPSINEKHITTTLVALQHAKNTLMKIDLQDLKGRWYINQSNFPMWLKGNKINPTFNYTVQEKGGKKGLLDVVKYEQNGKTKSIKGFDKVLDDQHTKFLWRGKGLMTILTSKWSILYLSPNKEWAIIYFKKTLFTPEGYDVISRNPTLSAEQVQAVDIQLRKLNIQANLQHIKQEKK